MTIQGNPPDAENPGTTPGSGVVNERALTSLGFSISRG
jgi:hypothetical protein